MRTNLVLLISAFLMIDNITIAQAPQLINYQAVARSANGNVLPNQFIKVELSIRDSSPTAIIVYQETDTTTTNQFGLFTVAIGAGQVQVGTNLTAVNWATGNKYLEVGFDPTGGNTFAEMGISELLSAPYALYAQTAGSGQTSHAHYIGEYYGGGIVFWADSTGQHGLISATTDQSIGVQWYNGSYTTTNAISNGGPGAGKLNTYAIVISQGSGSYAALICTNYQGGGYGDWYLPSLYALNLMYLNIGPGN